MSDLRIVGLVKAIPSVYNLDRELHISKWKINDVDKHVLEAALWFKENYGGQISVISVGPEDITDIIKESLAYGADKAYHIVSDSYSYSGLQVCTAIANLIRELDYDVIISGEASSDLYDSRVGPMLAAMLKLPFIPRCKSISREDEKLLCLLDSDSLLTVSIDLPCAIEVTRELGKPRIITILQMLQASKKPIDKIEIERLLGNSIRHPTIRVAYMDRVIHEREKTVYRNDIEGAVDFIVRILKREGII